MKAQTRVNTDQLLKTALHRVSLCTRAFPKQPVHIFNLWLASVVLSRTKDDRMNLKSWVNNGVRLLLSKPGLGGFIPYAMKPKIWGCHEKSYWNKKIPAGIFMLHILALMKPDSYDDYAISLLNFIYEGMSPEVKVEVQAGSAKVESAQDFLAHGQSILEETVKEETCTWLFPQLVLLWALRSFSTIGGKSTKGNAENLATAINNHFGSYPVENTCGCATKPATIALYEAITGNRDHIAVRSKPRPGDAIACSFYALENELSQDCLYHLAERVSTHGIEPATLFGATLDEARMANALGVMLTLA